VLKHFEDVLKVFFQATQLPFGFVSHLSSFYLSEVAYISQVFFIPHQSSRNREKSDKNL